MSIGDMFLFALVWTITPILLVGALIIIVAACGALFGEDK